MLDGADHHRSGPGRQRPQHGQVVGFRPARREGDVAGFDVKGGSHRIARLIDGGPGGASHLMRTRRVPEASVDPGLHRRHDARAERPAGGMVEIRQHGQPGYRGQDHEAAPHSGGAHHTGSGGTTVAGVPRASGYPATI